jgi:hypothetical protein
LKKVNRMWNDPIVDEVRKAGEELARQANYDLHTFCENLRQKEKQSKGKVVSFDKKTTPIK